MNFNFPLLKPIRILLFPFSLIYALMILARNWCYDRNIFTSTSFNLPIICIGNLVVGGTGKSPMVEFLVQKLNNDYSVAVLSRGYKRKTRGYALANQSSTALDIGDEPMQFHIKFPGVAVAVGEERIVAIPQLLHDRPATKTIILDDAFQHRSVKAGLNILLTDYGNLFTRDWFLPTGDLRDEKKSYKRAEIIVVTKCKEDLSGEEKLEIIGEIQPIARQSVFFSTIQYGIAYHIISKRSYAVNENTEVLLVTGIANPEQLKKYLLNSSKTYYEIAYSDHYIFTIDDLNEIVRRFNGIKAQNKIILTTEKDAVRLTKFQQELAGLPFYVMPIEPKILFDEEKQFVGLITTFISNFFKNKNKD
ncbi:MAG TPA: tetraacyldisaccharide 4'-kinase [Puia sp.]|jgi:tetraacyldisaccharide 4'-kinase|nr:tetraacyldisaccharide 4'-kinase [Puia sp.]